MIEVRRSGTELAREIKLTDWSVAGNLSNRSSRVQIQRDICTRLRRYLYSAKCSWIIKLNSENKRLHKNSYFDAKSLKMSLKPASMAFVCFICLFWASRNISAERSNLALFPVPYSFPTFP